MLREARQTQVQSHLCEISQMSTSIETESKLEAVRARGKGGRVTASKFSSETMQRNWNLTQVMVS